MKTSIITILICAFSYTLLAEEKRAKTPVVKCKKPHAESAYLLGKRHAQQHLKQGLYRIEIYGELTNQPSHYSQILKRNKIQLIPTAGCIVDLHITDHAKGYNEVMETAIKKKLGDDYFTKAESKARELAKLELKNRSKGN